MISISYDHQHGMAARRLIRRLTAGLAILLSEVFDGFEPPSQMSLGLNYRMNSNVLLTITSFAGLSETSPDFSLSGGVQWAF
jgi:hypothetical protein